MRLPTTLVLLCLACGASAQDLVVFDDALRNDFLPNYSYGEGTDLAHAVTTRNGSAASIAFTGNNGNAVAFPNEARDFTTAQYLGLRFFVHGGATGGQQLRLQLYDNLGGAPAANVELDSFIAGGSIAANEWRQVEVRFADAPLAFAGGFDRFDIQSDGAGVQPTLYLDDISLVAAVPRIFADSFEGSGGAGPTGNVRFVNAVGNLSQSVAEGAGLVSFQVERVNGSNGAVSVELQVAAGGSAVAPADFSLTTATASWATGESGARAVTLTVVDDPGEEADESVNLQLGNAAGGASFAAPNTATLTILANDAPPPVPGQLRFSAATYSAGEADGFATITVQRVGGDDGAASVSYATGDVTAMAPGDFIDSDGMLMWGDNDSADKTFTVPIVDDGMAETNEMVTLTLTDAAGATLGAPDNATLTIIEPELMFVPQYDKADSAGVDIRIYRRGAAGFSLLRDVVLEAGLLPNALAFAPDGKLWLLDNIDNRLLRYSPQDLLDAPNPVAEVTITLPSSAGLDSFDLAFFGDFLYVSQSNFGATHRILKFPLASLAVTGSPAATILTNPDLVVPAGLEFDAQGRLWVSNYGNASLVRLSTASGADDRNYTFVDLGARGSLASPEGLAFDAHGALWVGNNGEATISA